MKRMIFRETAAKPTTGLGLVLVIGAFVVVTRNPIPIPIPVWHWLMIGNYLIALALAVAGTLLIARNLIKILVAHNLIEERKSTL